MLILWKNSMQIDYYLSDRVVKMTATHLEVDRTMFSITDGCVRERARA